MGRMYAEGIAETGLPLDEQITWHLQGNFFPPVPLSMVEVCVKAIELYNNGESLKSIALPDGVGFRGITVAPVIEIIKAHRLETWIVEEDEEDGLAWED
jgi:hypothetical protein